MSLYFKIYFNLYIIEPNLILCNGMMKRFYLLRTCIKIMDVNRVIKIDTLFFTPQYKTIINETDKIKYLDLFLIINYHSYFESKLIVNHFM